MINKNSSGQPLSANYDSTVSESSRDWDMMLYLDGSPLDCSIKNVTIKKGSCGSTESFSIGNVYSSMMTAELLGLSTDIKNEDLEVRIGLNTGSTEWITLGWFTAIEVVKSVESTSVTAYGFSTSKTGGSFTIPQTLSLSNIASAIQTATGKTVTFGTGINTSYVLAGSIDEGTSCYAGLQILAHAVGGYAIDANDGGFLIDRFSDTATLSVSTEQMKYLPQVEELPFDITGVQVIATGQYRYFKTTDVAIDPEKTYYTYNSSTGEYEEVEEPEVSEIGNYYEREDLVYSYGTPVVLSDENPNMSADVFNIYKAIVGYSFYTGTIELTLGDPRIEGNDVLSVNIDGVDYAVPCHNVEHSYDGGLSTTVEAVKSSSEGTELISNAPISQQIDAIGMSASIAKASAESAVKYAEQAKQTTDEINAYADTVGKTVTQVLEDGETAGAAAEQAKTSADSAKQSADTAFKQLSVVEDIVGVLDLISKNGKYDRTQDPEVIPDKWYFTQVSASPPEYAVAEVATTYTLTEDTEIDPSKTYYTRSGTEPDYTYTPVENPVPEDLDTYYEAFRNPSEQGLYELTDIEKSIQNYVSSHLALDNKGLWLQLDKSSTKVLLSATEGVVMYDNNGYEVAKYGETTQIGNGDDFHIKLGIWYALTKDIAVVTGKTYYTRTGDPSTGYAYTEVENPVTADIGTYYEKMPAELGFYKGEYKIAYMSGQKLYIPQSVVLQQMDVGLPYGYIDPATQEQIGFGQWSWKLHLNNENPPRNNLNLKWIG